MPTKITPTQSETTFTIRQPPYQYIHLSLSTQPTSTNTSLDEITVRQYLTSALTQYLGLTGSAISIDILKVQGRDAWIRVPYEDAGAIVAALSQWVGARGGVSLRVFEKGSWLGGLTGGGVGGKALWT